MSSYYRYFSITIIVLTLSVFSCMEVQAQDNIPVREYTNPDEMIRFDRTTSFQRMLDVINQFSQENRGKVILDRTGTSGEIGISVPPMHWKDALDLVLNVKGLVLLEQEDFFEIVTQQSVARQDDTYAQGTTAVAGDSLKATTSTKEVRINAIFFEGNRRALREIGVDWSTLSENVPDAVLGGGQGGGGQGGGGQQGGATVPNASFEADGPFVQVNAKGAQNVSQDVFSALVNVGEIGTTGIEVQALFSAFEADNLGEILSSPSVKVVDGQPGRIQVGQDFSIKQRDFAGNVTDEFFSVGTILEVTPTVIEQRDTTFIHVEINAERSSAQPDPVSTIINKQQASTQAILLDGESTVIAGLYRTDQSEVRRGIPILKDLPPWFFGLRYLFGYSAEDYQMRELVVLIEASIEPSIPERFAERENLPDRFDVLNEERNRVRDAIINQTKNDNLVTDETIGDDKDDAGYNDPKQNGDKVKQDSLEATPKKEKPNTPKEEKDKEDEKPVAKKEREDPKVEDPPVVDPEVKNESIPLNFSTEKKDQPNTESDTTQKVEMKPKEEPTPKVDKKAVENTSSFSYYIIAGAFNSESNANNFKESLLEEGYDAEILEKSGSDILFVAYRGYNDLERAQTALADITQYENNDAWLYKNN
ncbi:MAG: SPOR domain-containing protein [Balneolaceae bacterium]|nr:SPOR domain-containing protein [Balneolaceae bacterium]